PQAVVPRRDAVQTARGACIGVDEWANSGALVDVIEEAARSGVTVRAHRRFDTANVLEVEHRDAMLEVALAVVYEPIGLRDRIVVRHKVVEAEQLAATNRGLDVGVAPRIDKAV